MSDSISQPADDSMKSSTNVGKQIVSHESDFIYPSMSLPKKHSIPYLKLVEDTKKYKRDQLYFLENPKLLYSPDFYYESPRIESYSNFEDEGLSIGIFQSASSTRCFSRRHFLNVYFSNQTC